MNATVRMVWWVNRLRCMSVAEIGYRVRRAARPVALRATLLATLVRAAWRTR